MARTTHIRCKITSYQRMKDLLKQKSGQLTKGDISENTTTAIDNYSDKLEAELDKRSDE